MKTTFTLLACVFLNLFTKAQTPIFSVGVSQTLFIKSGTIFGADSLIMNPGSDLTLSGNSLWLTHTPVLGVPNSSIARMYYWGTQITFTGTLQLYYKLSELNGNVESQLEFSDSSFGNSVWMVEGAGTVNTTNHYVQYIATSHVFTGATAAQVGTVLPVKLLFFGGSWQNDQVLLQWTMDMGDPTAIYQPQYSADQLNWSSLPLVYGVASEMPVRFYQIDPDLVFNSRFYRVKIIDPQGNFTSSPVIRMDRAGATNTLAIAVAGRNARLYFLGDLPSGVRVFNSGGQQVWLSQSQSAVYDIFNLVPGVYLAQYKTGASMHARKFIIP